MSFSNRRRKNGMDTHKRAKIWNSYFKMAWLEAKVLWETNIGQPSHKEFSGVDEIVDAEQIHSAGTLVLCALAIEARANYLIADLVEEGRISEKVGNALQWLPAEHKWCLIPTMINRPAPRMDRSPHQAIAQICSWRNKLVHSRYNMMEDPPQPNLVLSYFKNFVCAMEDMNVLLGRGNRTEPKQEVIALGEFD
jgi:hypothetical protein